MALFLQIRLLEYVSDGFISSAIGKITTYMKLTEAMAGATLLAFSNGATDIITTVVASGNEDNDDLAVGALFGASTFALTIILAVVIWARPGKVIKEVKNNLIFFQLQRGNFVRDVVVYLISVTIFIVLGFFSTPYWIIGSVLILIYVIYVILVWMEEKNKKSTIGGSEMTESTEDDNYLSLEGTAEKKSMSSLDKSGIDDEEEEEEKAEEHQETAFEKMKRRVTSFIGEIQVNFWILMTSFCLMMNTSQKIK